MREIETGGIRLRHFTFSDEQVLACVTTRLGGVSKEPFDSLNLGLHVGDDAAAVLENRARVCAALGRPLTSLTVANQVHAGHVVVVDDRERGRGSLSHDDAIAETDALITATPGLLLGVMLADCVPVVLFDPAKRVIAVAHAGWRGTVAHVTRDTLRAMSQTFGCRPTDIVAGIGPSIGPDSYEVGPEVADAATAAYPGLEVVRTDTQGRSTFDLWAANWQELVGEGVRADHIELAGIDTRSRTDEFFSDRAQRPCGRFMALAALGQ